LTQDGASTFGYDATGNRTNTGYSTGTGNRITTDGVWTYTHDAEGNLVKKSQGALADTWVYAYDNRNQMTSAIESATDGGAATQQVTYFYDALGNRIGRIGWDGATTTTERYGLDGWDTAKPSPVGNESFDTWVDLDGSNVLTMRRMYGTEFDEVVARQTSGGTVNWYLTERQGSVTEVIDNSASVLGTVTYTAYGSVASGSLWDRYGYTGQQHDLLTGFVSMGEGTREYDPTTGKFLSEDPKGFAAGDANLFRYVGNGPTNATDPSGQTLYVTSDDVEKWIAASGDTLSSYSTGNGFSILTVSEKARTPEIHNKLWAYMRQIGYSEDQTTQAINALYNGGIKQPGAGYSILSDRLAVLNLKGIKPTNGIDTGHIPLVLNPNVPQVLPKPSLIVKSYTSNVREIPAMSEISESDWEARQRQRRNEYENWLKNEYQLYAGSMCWLPGPTLPGVGPYPAGPRWLGGRPIPPELIKQLEPSLPPGKAVNPTNPPKPVGPATNPPTPAGPPLVAVPTVPVQIEITPHPTVRNTYSVKWNLGDQKGGMSFKVDPASKEILIDGINSQAFGKGMGGSLAAATLVQHGVSKPPKIEMYNILKVHVAQLNAGIPVENTILGKTLTSMVQKLGGQISKWEVLTDGGAGATHIVVTVEYSK